ncbi:metalloregulator ArsR/SmtB family transcription factor [Ktedonobacter racemifer]|uniref:Transcriptional regulator, ArsR family n=1 Tax=Ktedonobacter racemifer DSM 44963 TaxID=485913 RepID=D6TM83_KTERA|nr:metalloregulator ArsR/SmtB family transcription factor [Ktedonobacter racemifer]EFH86883.1 transcriptional regulator, ArsR family [Ktedonobacter racemifer DSM 44963]
MKTSTAQLPSILKLIAHDIRWAVLRELAHSDYRVQELVERLGLPQNLVSYHLRKLREGQVVSERRSSADEREVYYRLNLDQLQGRYLAAGSLIHPAVTMGMEQRAPQEPLSHGPGLRVLFLCTENSARSQMAEALLRQESQGMVEAYSAGSQPAAHIHPLTRRVMEQMGIDMSQATPKPLHLFEGQHFDAIVTVCDRVREVCPTFSDDPERIHWSFPDPATVQGTEAEQLHTFEQTALQLTTRIRSFLPLLERKKSNPREQ